MPAPLPRASRGAGESDQPPQGGSGPGTPGWTTWYMVELVLCGCQFCIAHRPDCSAPRDTTGLCLSKSVPSQTATFQMVGSCIGNYNCLCLIFQQDISESHIHLYVFKGIFPWQVYQKKQVDPDKMADSVLQQTML